MVSKPLWAAVYSAARTAPKAKPTREWASCVMVISSASLQYFIECIPGTSPSRMLLMVSFCLSVPSAGVTEPSGFFTVPVCHPVFLSRCDACSRRVVELMDMVCLCFFHIILCEAVHDLCKVFIHCRENCHTDREV